LFYFKEYTCFTNVFAKSQLVFNELDKTSFILAFSQSQNRRQKVFIRGQGGHDVPKRDKNYLFIAFCI